MENNKNQLPWLDWMRFGAAFVVLLCHAREATWVPWRNLPSDSKNLVSFSVFSASHFSLEPVTIFFVLSGLLVGGKLIDRTINGTFSLADYTVDRVTRIYTPFLPALLFSGLIFLCSKGQSPGGATFLGNLFGLQTVVVSSFGANYALWSLAYEIWFYVLAGAVAHLLSRSSQNKIASFLVISVAVIIFNRLNAVYLFCWIIGALSWQLRDNVSSRRALILGTLLLVAGLAIIHHSPQAGEGDGPAVEYPGLSALRQIGLIIFSAGVAVAALYLSRRSMSGLSTKVNAVGVRLAAGSYTLYLVHYPVLRFWEYFQPQRAPVFNAYFLAIFLAKVSSSLLVAWLMYYAFERRTADVRRWLKAKNLFRNDRS